MGEKLGRPLTEDVGKPRVLPDAVPLPMPDKVPVPEKKEKLPVLPDGTEALLRFRADQARNGTISAVARMLKVPEAEVREMMDNIVSRVSAMFHRGGGLGKAPHVPNAS